MASTASGPLAAITSAISRAFSRAVPSGTTRPISPISLASWARPSRAVSSRSMATVKGICRTEAHRRAPEREEAPPGLEHAELGALPGHPDVGGLQDLGAPGHGPALDGGDQRLLQR